MSATDAEATAVEMPNGVDRGDEAWPREHWHPIYDSVVEWLNNEAPEPPPRAVAAAANAANRRHKGRRR